MNDFDRWNDIKAIWLLLAQKLEYRVIGDENAITTSGAINDYSIQ